MNPVFETHSPLAVVLWDRLLAYGAALGVAHGASGPLPLGVGEGHGRVEQPRGPLARDLDLLPQALAAGMGRRAGVSLGRRARRRRHRGLLALSIRRRALDAGLSGWMVLLGACVAVVVGVAVVIVAASDWATAVEVTGPILRLRALGDDDKPRYYVAVDDGVSTEIRAFRVGRSSTRGSARATSSRCVRRSGSGRVRWIVPASTAI